MRREHPPANRRRPSTRPDRPQGLRSTVDTLVVRVGAHAEAWSPDWLLYRYRLGRRIMIVASAAVWMITVVVAARPNTAPSVLITPGIAVLDALLTVALLRAIQASFETEFYRAVGG
jgi:hypothetical protein